MKLFLEIILILVLAIQTASAKRYIVQFKEPPLCSNGIVCSKAMRLPSTNEILYSTTNRFFEQHEDPLKHEEEEEATAAATTTTTTTLNKMKIRAKTIALQHNLFLKELKTRELGNVVYLGTSDQRKLIPAQFTLFVNCITIEITNRSFISNEKKLMEELLYSLPNVLTVQEERQYKPTLFLSRQLIGAFDSWNLIGGNISNAGKGVKIAMVDAGFDVNHAMFSDDGFEFPDDWNDEGKGDAENTNKKVIASRGYFDWASNPPATIDSHSYPSIYSSSHGVHTSSTASGRKSTAKSSNIPSFEISGIAPGAWLMNYRIFYIDSGFNDVYCGDSQILQAFEDLAKDGADICSNSWGSDAFYNSKGSVIDIAINNMVQYSDIVVVFAAGNSGPKKLTIDRPSPSIRVAATTTSGFIGQFVLITNPATNPIPFEYGTIGPAASSTERSLISPDSNSDDILGCNDLSLKYSFNGKAVIVKRGVCTFVTKILSVQRAGGLMAIIYNHETGGDELITMGGDSSGIGISAIFIGNTDGSNLLSLISNKNINVTVSAKNGIDVYPSKSDVVASFSSRGPTVDMELAPDIAAPGVQILAAGYGNGLNPHLGYGVVSGTSMATPHVSGVSALILQKNPKFTQQEVKSALITTANFKDVMLRSNKPAQPLEIGGGRVDSFRAVNPILFINPPTISFSIVPQHQHQLVTKSLNISLYLNETISVTSKIVIHSGKGTTEIAPSWITASPSTFSLKPKTSMLITVSLNTDLCGIGDKQFYLVFENTTSGIEFAHSPIWARVICSETQKTDVFLIDLDTSSCIGSTQTDLLPLYKQALTDSSLSFSSWSYNCSGIFSLPIEVEMLCSRSVLVFSGTQIVDITNAEEQLRMIMHSGTPIIQMGNTIGYCLGLDNSSYTINGILSNEFNAYFQLGFEKITRIGGAGLSPSAFSALFWTTDTKVRPLLITNDVDQTVFLSDQHDSPLVQSYMSKPITTIPYSVYNSKGVISTVGIEFLGSTIARSTVVKLLYQHVTETLGTYTLSSSGKEPYFTIDIECESKMDIITIGWSDGNQNIFYQTSQVSITHGYSLSGNYTPQIIVQTSLGRSFALDTGSINFVCLEDHSEISNSNRHYIFTIPFLSFFLFLIFSH